MDGNSLEKNIKTPPSSPLKSISFPTIKSIPMRTAWLSPLRFYLRTLRYQIPSFPQIPRIPSFCGMIAVFAVCIACNFQPAYQVTVNGVAVGFAESPQVVQNATALLESSLRSLYPMSSTLSDDISLSSCLALPSERLDTNELIHSIANASESIHMMSAITVNGQIVGACLSDTDTEQVLQTLLSQYCTSDTDVAEFVQDVQVKTVVMPISEALTSAELLQTLQQNHAFDVQVTRTEQYTRAIPFQTQKIQSDQVQQNLVQTIQMGQNGMARIEEKIVTLNGVETVRTISDYTVLSAPTDCIVAVGTDSGGVGNGQFIVPVSGYRFTSAFKFRNERWHKGVDLALPVGSPVFAADSGVVITSELSDSYGNYIIIDHQNGLKTVYAHNSSLLVQVGDVVSKGQQIALSGNTGNSTGPHLHFEIRLHDTAVNPEIYLSFGTETP